MTQPHTLRQPVYRRPSWAQSDKSYEHYMRKDLSADRSPGHDYGMENFSYDAAHLSKWQIPKDLEARLPPQLRDATADWKYAGAAVCTALDRIDKLDDESLYRGYPEKAHGHLSRNASNAGHTTTGAGMDTPPLSSPVSPTPIALKSSLLGLEKLTPLEMIQRKPIGMESPPFTPVDSQTCPTPEVHGDTPAPASPGPDVFQLTRQLSPISMNDIRRDSISGAASSSYSDSKAMSSFSSTMSTTSSTPSLATFDENAWETFVNTYKAELLDIRQHAWSRFKGHGYTIDKLRVEAGMEKGWKDVVHEFNAWWASMKPQVAKYEEKVRELQVPTVELMRLERMAKGLYV